jgi:uncharacterized protein (TIGR02145 family)
MLTDYVGGLSIAGGVLKESGIIHWTAPNTGATNEIGFTALPGGARYYFGSFGEFGDSGFWWSSSEIGVVKTGAGAPSMDYLDVSMDIAVHYKQSGFSVRCLKDN